MRNLPWTTNDEDELIALRRNNLSWREIASRLGRTEAALVGRYNKLMALRGKETPRRIEAICSELEIAAKAAGFIVLAHLLAMTALQASRDAEDTSIQPEITETLKR